MFPRLRERVFRSQCCLLSMSLTSTVTYGSKREEHGVGYLCSVLGLEWMGSSGRKAQLSVCYSVKQQATINVKRRQAHK